MKEFYKDNTAKVFYDQELDTLFLEYTGKVLNDDQFVRINTAVLNAFISLKSQKFVADVRKMGIISLNSQKWVVENLLPGMMKHLNGRKLFHAQLLDPSEVMAKVSAANIKNKAKNDNTGFEVVQFTDRGELTEYLKKAMQPK